MPEKESLSRTFKRLWSSDYAYGIEARESIRENLGFLKDHYDLRVTFGRQKESDKPGVEVSKLSLREAHFASQILKEEVSKYPPEFLKACDIKNLRVVNSLRLNNEQLLGVAFDDGTVYVEMHPWDSRARMTIHHELFHSSDHEYVDQGSDHPIWGDLMDSLRGIKYDYNWGRINTLGYMGDKYVDADDSTGFAEPYGRKNEWEDRATTAALLMTNPQRAKELAKSYPVFRRKIIKVATIMRHRSKGKMDQAYFNDLFAGRVNDHYWNLV